MVEFQLAGIEALEEVPGQPGQQPKQVQFPEETKGHQQESDDGVEGDLSGLSPNPARRPRHLGPNGAHSRPYFTSTDCAGLLYRFAVTL